MEVVLNTLDGKGHWHSNDPAGVMTSEEIWEFVSKYTLTEKIEEPEGINHALKVTTSEDVEAITVNGIEITEYKLVREWKFWSSVTYKRVWTYEEKIKAAGTYTYEVVAYSADGTASEPLVTELTVTRR